MSDSTAAQHTTASLLNRVRDGDMAARTALIARVEPLLRRFAHGRVPQQLRHQEDTGDLVQLTWLKVLDRLPSIEVHEPGAFFAYLRTVLINALRDSLRREGRSPVQGDGEVVDAVAAVLPVNQTDPDDWLIWEQSLSILAPYYRGLVLMRFEFGMSFAEIGVELGESSDGVRMKLNRAIARMAAVAS